MQIFALLSVIPVFAGAEVIQLGGYSGRPGYFAKIGTEFQLTLDAIIMNSEVSQKIRRLKFGTLGETKQCDVEGLHQAVGYTIFEIKSCK